MALPWDPLSHGGAVFSNSTKVGLSSKLASPEAYSKYMFQVTPETFSLLRCTSSAPQLRDVYVVDVPDRAALVVASAFACWGYHAEDTELIRFATALNAAKLATPGLSLPTRDRIDQQKGDNLPLRDYDALAIQPDYSSVPVLGAAAVAETSFPALSNIASPLTVAVDVKANDLLPANMNFAPLSADVVTNDRALLWSDENELCARFKSEVGGPLGGLDVVRHLPNADVGEEQFSPYALCINSARQVYARSVLGDKRYNVDLPDRAVLILAGALAAVAYTRTDFSLKRVAEGIYAARASLTTVGEDLPAQDRLQAQTQPRMSSYTTAMLEQSEAAANFCRPSSPGYSLFRCIGNGMQGLSGY